LKREEDFYFGAVCRCAKYTPYLAYAQRLKSSELNLPHRWNWK